MMTPMPVYDLKTGYPDINLVPRERISEITAEVLRSGRGWQYGGDLQGTLPTRQPLAQFVSQASGVPVTPEEVMITGGALTAIDIACRSLTQPGDVVVVEDPTFYFVAQVIRMSHDEVVSVPLKVDGIELDALSALCDRFGERLKVVYAIPSFQNPTGITATNRAALAELAQRRNFTVIEDSTYQLLYFEAPPPPYLKTYDPSGHVITVGSFSKLLMPSLRSGWIWALPDQIQEFKKFKDDAGSTLTAEIVGDYIKSGELPGQIEHARQLYASRHNVMVAALDRYAPAWLDWSAPNGGFFVWATLPEGMTAVQVEPLAAARGVSFMAGRNCYIDPHDDRHLRLCFAKMEEAVLTEGIARLSNALNEARKQT
jgi:DNA-binding transcriptional MocR family regulator